MSKRISPTAAYGGVTRGPRVVTDETRRELEKIFQEVRDGSFAREWMSEVKRGMPKLEAAKTRVAASALQRAWEQIGAKLS